MYQTPNDLSVISILITFFTKREKYINKIEKLNTYNTLYCHWLFTSYFIIFFNVQLLDDSEL